MEIGKTTSPEDNLIVIASDDDSDSDVEFLGEEQDDTLDVILVSHEMAPAGKTSLNKPQRSDLRTSTSCLRPSNEVATPKVNLSRHLSISSNLDLNLRLNENLETSPLDLSKVTEDDSLETKSEVSSCTLASSSSGSSLDSDSDESSTTSVDSSNGTGPLNAESNALNLDIPLSTSLGFGQRDQSCKMTAYNSLHSDDFTWNSGKVFTDRNLRSSPTNSVFLSDANVGGNHGNNFTLLKQLGLDDVSNVTNDDNMQLNDTKSPKRDQQDNRASDCSSPKRPKVMRSSPDNIFNLDAWDSLKKDLDFLNSASTPCLSVNTSCSTSTQSLSNSMQSANAGKSCGSSTNYGGSTSLLPCNDQVFQCSARRTSVPDGLSSVTNSSHLPLKKQLHVRCFRQNSEPANRMPRASTSSDWGSESCTRCKVSLLGMLTSRCLQGHATCGSCLEEHVKLVLTGKSKESLRCVLAGCDSYYPKSELSRSLPSMVVEILNDKLDMDHIDYIANMLMKNATSSCQGEGEKKSSTSTSEEECDVKESPKVQRSEKQSKIMSDLPSHWEEMDIRNEPYKIVDLEPDSPEYVDVALKFYDTLKFPLVDIKKISRVQNHILWKYYTVKKTEMVQENDGLAVNEKSLFHGTSISVVEAICKKGFDWRVCGKHGTVYGQGSYFALDSSYSHNYTENRNRRPRMSMNRIIHQNSSIFSFPVYPKATNCNGQMRSRPSQSWSHSFQSQGAQDLTQKPLFQPSGTSQASSQQAAVASSSINQSQQGCLGSSSLMMPNSIVNTSSNQVPSQFTAMQNLSQAGSSQSSVNSTTNLGHPSPSTPSSDSSNNIDTSSQRSIIAMVQTVNCSSGSTVSSSGSSSSSGGAPTSSTNDTPQFGLKSQLISAVLAQARARRHIISPPSLHSSHSGSSNLGNAVGMLHPLHSLHKPNLPQFSPAIPHQSAFMISSQQNYDPFEHKEVKTTHKMFMARVLVGRYTGGSASLRKPPPLDEVNDPYGKCYDSCVDNIHTPKIFVIFDTSQAYPEYLIEYEFTS